MTLDYGQPREVLPLLERLAHDSLASRVEKAGEPFRLFFTPAEIAAEFSRFQSIEDLGAAGLMRAISLVGPINLRSAEAPVVYSARGYRIVARSTRDYSYLRDSTGSSCAARVAGRVPKTTPTMVAAASAIIADSPEIGIR